MTAEVHQLETTPGPGRVATPQLRTLVVCDIADSTALVERMGDQDGAGIIRKHDRFARALVERHQGREIDKTDGFLLLFERPVQAAAFALEYQRGLKHLFVAEGVVVRARVGIHMGDVVVWENAPDDVAHGAKPVEVEGLVKPIAARLAQLALPQQILMSSAAAGIAHRAEGELGAETVRHVRWKNHGKYTFKGLPDPLEVVEVGEDDVAPLHAPKSGRTAKKVLPWWRRPLTLAAEAAALAIGIGIGAWIVLQSPPTLAFAARDWVVVGNVQNHTNQTQLGAPLDSAFKIGLEQSRYVNVIPDIQVESTLKRMEKSAGTPVNRIVGADVAMREGARALILPSLAQVGGRIQISAEVIDPHTGVTVYSDSTLADTENQVLPATDKLLGKLRSRLGESLASIQKTSMPLAQITTSNMDALQAFAEATQAIGDGKVKQGLVLLHQAITLDPNFSLAWARLGSMQDYYLQDSGAAYTSFQTALQKPDRLSVRERLAVEGAIAWYRDGSQWLDKWSAYARLYPDSPAAQDNLGMGFYDIKHDLKAALPHFLAAANSRHPLRGVAWYQAAMVDTGLGSYADAEAAVAEGRKLGTVAPEFEDVSPDLAQRHYKAVLERVNAKSGELPPTMEAERFMRLAAVDVDRGEDSQAQSALAAAAKAAAAHSAPAQQARVELAQVSLGLTLHEPAARAALKGLVADESKRATGPLRMMHGDAAVNLALAAMLAARDGDAALARSALDAAQDLALNHGFYARAALWRTADCEVMFANAAKDQITCLTKLLDGREYFQTHVALWRAYNDAGDPGSAVVQRKWMQDHRGQAIAELPRQPALIMNLLALRAISSAPRTSAGLQPVPGG